LQVLNICLISIFMIIWNPKFSHLSKYFEFKFLFDVKIANWDCLQIVEGDKLQILDFANLDVHVFGNDVGKIDGAEGKLQVLSLGSEFDRSCRQKVDQRSNGLNVELSTLVWLEVNFEKLKKAWVLLQQMGIMASDFYLVFKQDFILEKRKKELLYDFSCFLIESKEYCVIFGL